ncbi:endonuclease/exonuclease/phosphatase family protein [Geomonas oryzisoli]|uniref:Endonuclease/exonuclease/phosphatase family protein n=1 Tax=Geomonas oryzisoli TaxID=2847992 RepID=A0ABX8J9G2_9BACT|nr:endonuclease/exonuclease/phosphatase family protein [Geomonas oryzisoli]QWV93761.1 endonuclease/exonuclease/phosphatase family protein [Geomonas oryzisoli]
MSIFNWLLGLNVAYIFLLAAITILNRVGPDRFWVAALNFYLPQLIWAIPGLVLALAACRSAKILVWVPLLGVLWVLGPIMDWHWAPHKAWADPPQTLRVMTWNVKYGKRDLMPLIEELARSRPDIILFQDAVDAGSGPLADYLTGWQMHNEGQYLVASRFPIFDVEVHDLPYHERKGESFLRCRVRVGARDISLYNVHFKTPRRGLNAFRKARRGAWYIPKAIDRFEANVDTRLRQARAVSGYLAQEEGEVVVAGDFNSPDHSLVCETLRKAGLADAFAQAGRGYGYSYGHFLLRNKVPWVRASWMRIDHIMTTSGIKAQRCWVGTRRASDHRPVIADFYLGDSR